MRVTAFVSLGLALLALLLLAQQPSANLPKPTPVSGPVVPTVQSRVDPTNSYHRVLAIVPMTGSGTHDDPKRPMFVPAPANAVAGDRSGIIAWQHQMSDDGTLAIVEIVATTRDAFAPLFSANDSRVKVFEVGVTPQADMESSLQAVKASFSFANFRPLAVQ